MPRIKFTTNGANSLIGGFAAGDLLTCSAAMAEHLVHQARCAVYVEPQVKPAAEVPPPAAKTRKTKEPKP
jgi:hypothetical protein